MKHHTLWQPIAKMIEGSVYIKQTCLLLMEEHAADWYHFHQAQNMHAAQTTPHTLQISLRLVNGLHSHFA